MSVVVVVIIAVVARVVVVCLFTCLIGHGPFQNTPKRQKYKSVGLIRKNLKKTR